MIEIRLEIEPKNKTPLECMNLVVESLESLVKNQDIQHYILKLCTTSDEFDETVVEAIHAGGKDVTP